MGKVAFGTLVLIALVFLISGLRFIVYRTERIDAIIGALLISGAIQLAVMLARYFS